MSSFFSVNFGNNQGVRDSNYNEQLLFGETGSATDYMVITNASGNNSNVQVSAAGDSTNVGINLLPKNAGNVNILSSSTPGGLRLYSSTDPTTTKFTGLTAPSAPTGVTFTLPASDGTNGQALTTAGDGTLSFTTITAGAGGSTTQVQWNNDGSLDGLSNVTVTNDGILVGTNLQFDSSTSNIYADSGGLRIGSTEAITLHHATTEGIVVTDNVSSANITLFNDTNTIKYDGTDIAVAASGDINLTATGDVNIPSGVGLTFADDGERIVSDGTDLTIASGSDIILTPTNDIVVSGTSKFEFNGAGSGEHISGDGTDLTIASGSDINLTATGDVNIPSGVGLTFADDGERIVSDGTDLTIASGSDINLTATNDLVVTTDKFIYASPQTITVGDGQTINDKVTYTNTAITKPIVYFQTAGGIGGTYLYQFNANSSNVAGEIKHLFFDDSGANDVDLTIDFGPNNLSAGSGLVQYLTFNTNGESASLIYVGSKWRILNTGATVS